MSNTPLPDTTPWVPGQLLALGGTAAVYRADGPTGAAALKVPRAASGHAALHREADLLRRAAHPHLPRLLDADISGRWLASELVQGETLDRWARRRPTAAVHTTRVSDAELFSALSAPVPREEPSVLDLRPVDEVVGVGLELIDVVRHLHRQGFVHGDITPRNAIIDAWGHLKLLDAGAPAPSSEPSRHTPGFTAPEVLRGQPVSRASDAWGVGAVLYAAFAGRAPFSSPDPVALAHQATTSSPIPASAWRTDLPARLDRLIEALLSRDPHRRPTLEAAEKVLARHTASLPARHPVLGMERVRTTLHALVALASSGGPVVVTVHGPVGSGRRTLVAEVVRQAQREGFRFLDRPDAAAFADTQDRGMRPVMALRARTSGVVDLARRAMRVRKPAILALYDTVPVPELATSGYHLVTPDPLDLDAVRALAAYVGATPSVAEQVRATTHGHPAATWHALMARSQRRQPKGLGPTPTRTANAVLDALRQQPGAHGVIALARQLHLHPQVFVDECAPLVAAGLITFGDGGRTVAAVPPRDGAGRGPGHRGG